MYILYKRHTHDNNVTTAILCIIFGILYIDSCFDVLIGRKIYKIQKNPSMKKTNFFRWFFLSRAVQKGKVRWSYTQRWRRLDIVHFTLESFSILFFKKSCAIDGGVLYSTAQQVDNRQRQKRRKKSQRKYKKRRERWKGGGVSIISISPPKKIKKRKEKNRESCWLLEVYIWRPRRVLYLVLMCLVCAACQLFYPALDHSYKMVGGWKGGFAARSSTSLWFIPFLPTFNRFWNRRRRRKVRRRRRSTAAPADHLVFMSV